MVKKFSLSPDANCGTVGPEFLPARIVGEPPPDACCCGAAPDKSNGTTLDDPLPEPDGIGLDIINSLCYDNDGFFMAWRQQFR